MRFIVLRSLVNEKGNLVLHGLTSLTQKPAGVVDGWIDMAEAKTNCHQPQNCDLLSFEDPDQLQENLDLWGIASENVAIIGVEAE